MLDIIFTEDSDVLEVYADAPFFDDDPSLWFIPDGDPRLQAWAITIYVRGSNTPVVDTINAVSEHDALDKAHAFVDEWYPNWRGFDVKPYAEWAGEMVEAA